MTEIFCLLSCAFDKLSDLHTKRGELDKRLHVVSWTVSVYNYVNGACMKYWSNNYCNNFVSSRQPMHFCTFCSIFRLCNNYVCQGKNTIIIVVIMVFTNAVVCDVTTKLKF